METSIGKALGTPFFGEKFQLSLETFSLFILNYFFFSTLKQSSAAFGEAVRERRGVFMFKWLAKIKLLSVVASREENKFLILSENAFHPRGHWPFQHLATTTLPV